MLGLLLCILIRCLGCMAIFIYLNIYFYVFNIHLYCLVGCLSMIVWTHAVLGVLYACVLYFCVCTCSARLSMFHVERPSRNTLITIINIIVIVVVITTTIIIIIEHENRQAHIPVFTWRVPSWRVPSSFLQTARDVTHSRHCPL